jgi:ABC-type transport system involved in cytochrome c biogenesis permease subunit
MTSRNLSFITLAAIIVVLVIATFVERFYGTDFTHDHIYASPWAIALWALCATSAVIYIVRRHRSMSLPTITLHAALVLILVGALVSHITADSGRIHLRADSPQSSQYVTDNGDTAQLPFAMSLTGFEVAYYPGTQSAMDFVSDVRISDGTVGKVSMNNVLEHRGYRFYQSAFDSDKGGVTLLVAHDTWGIGVTYAAYALLALSMAGFFFAKKSRWHAIASRGITTAVILSVGLGASAAPRTIDRQLADSISGVYIYYNERVCPFETFANDAMLKLTGSRSYGDLDAVQVVMGLLLYYDQWKTEPFIKIKGDEARKVLGIDGKYAALTDFVSLDGFKLENALHDDPANRTLADANEKFGLASSIATGSAFTMFPATQDGAVTWYAPTDKLPASIDNDQWIFVRRCFDLLAQYVYDGNTADALTLVSKLKKYQSKYAGEDNMPSPTRVKAERLYNHLPSTFGLAILCIIAGFAGYIATIVRTRQRKSLRTILLSLTVFAIAALCYLSMLIALRWIVGAHVPLANGYETMTFMAWCCLVLALTLPREWRRLVQAPAILAAGLSMMVAWMGEINPQISQLMPVLASPLLSIHVVSVMMAYALLAIVMLNGIAAICSRSDTEMVTRLWAVSKLMLYPAVFLLCAGIFIGAVWANNSWGTYWSWDPKETWALITLLVYSLALHDSSLPWMSRHMTFHIYVAVAFLAVLVTYFGVNIFFGGMHSYS